MPGWAKRAEEVPAPDARLEVVSLIRKKERLLHFGDGEQRLSKEVQMRRKAELRMLEAGAYSDVTSQARCRCFVSDIWVFC